MESKLDRANRRKLRVRIKIGKDYPRLTIYRSNKYLFAQIIDDKKGNTVLGITDKKIVNQKGKEKKGKSDIAKEFGVKFGKEAVSKGIKKVVFDRSSYLYHGRVKAFADGAREGGLEF